jgi:3-methyladenine DNA glycosylase AlkD
MADDRPSTAVEVVVAGLRAAGRPERAARERAYLKSDLEHWGAGVPAVRAVARTFARSHPGLPASAVRSLVRDLWAEPVHERRLVVVELLDAYRALLEPADLDLVARFVRAARTWALVDGLAATVAGGIVERFPAAAGTLDSWVDDPDFWLRRSALLALLVPLRRGAGDFDRFGRYADALLDEREFFVAKAIGWVLRDTARRRPELVAAWLVPRAARAAPVTVREAVKYLAPEDRARVRAARGGKGTSP